MVATIALTSSCSGASLTAPTLDSEMEEE
eukprot:SAG31_NODE_4797_length_2952_cov_6.463722_1_plen_28_part_10